MSSPALTTPARGGALVGERPNSGRVVILVHNSADLYGASRSLLRLTRELQRRSIRPVVILPEAGALLDELGKSDILVFVEPGLSVITREIYRSVPAFIRFVIGIPRSATRIARIGRQVDAALIHTNTGVIVSPALAARMCGLPHIWHIRDSFQEFGKLWRAYQRYIRNFSTRVICVSTAIAAQFPRDDRVRVINNGFPLEEFEVDRAELRRQFRSAYGIAPNEVVVGVVGRIKFARKGQEFLVHAMKELADRGVRCRLAIVGGTAAGNEQHEVRLRELVTQLDLTDVTFCGELSDSRPAYAGMDILVLPSGQPEPFGGVVIEAMAMTLPVVATNIGGSIDQVEHGVTGLLVPPADPSALANALEPLIREPSLRGQFGAAGRERMKARFHIDGMVERLIGEYNASVREVSGPHALAWAQA